MEWWPRWTWWWIWRPFHSRDRTARACSWWRHTWGDCVCLTGSSRAVLASARRSVECSSWSTCCPCCRGRAVLWQGVPCELACETCVSGVVLTNILIWDDEPFGGCLQFIEVARCRLPHSTRRVSRWICIEERLIARINRPMPPTVNDLPTSFRRLDACLLYSICGIMSKSTS